MMMANHEFDGYEKLLADTDSRHQKLLLNIVSILKINDLFEEYRRAIENLKAECKCRRSKVYWDRIDYLEAKYKELIPERKQPTVVTPITTTLTLSHVEKRNGNKLGAKVISAEVVQAAPVVAKSPPPPPKLTTATAATAVAANSTLNFAIFNTTIGKKNEKKVEPGFTLDTHIKEEIVTECSPILHDDDDEDSGSFADHLNNNVQHTGDISVSITEPAGNGGGGGENSNTITVGNDDEVNLIEEEEILDDEGDAEEELDIDEYLALLEILEKEGGQNKFEKEEDSENEYILAIRNVTSNEIICYECVVGGACGFLSRERARMLLHVSKHFQGVPDSEQEDENSKIDISIIPVNPDQPSGGREFRKSSNNLSNRYISFKTFNPKTLKSRAGEKPIRCEWDNCTFMCDQNYKLRTHIRQVHEKVRPYLCDWPGCFGAYKTRSNLASHRMVHTGERPFICDFPKCYAKFARKYDCERHRRIHSEKMYACEWPGCGKRLCDPYNLERHMMVHKGELPFRCPLSSCVRGFRELRYLRDHMVNHHKFLPDTNQLRLACLNSSKLVSISGYDLNESNSECSQNEPAPVAATTTTTSNNNNPPTTTTTTAFVTAVVSQGNLKRTETDTPVVVVSEVNSDSDTIEDSEESAKTPTTTATTTTTTTTTTTATTKKSKTESNKKEEETPTKPVTRYTYSRSNGSKRLRRSQV